MSRTRPGSPLSPLLPAPFPPKAFCVAGGKVWCSSHATHPRHATVLTAPSRLARPRSHGTETQPPQGDVTAVVLGPVRFGMCWLRPHPISPPASHRGSGTGLWGRRVPEALKCQSRAAFLRHRRLAGALSHHPRVGAEVALLLEVSCVAAEPRGRAAG